MTISGIIFFVVVCFGHLGSIEPGQQIDARVVLGVGGVDVIKDSVDKPDSVPKDTSTVFVGFTQRESSEPGQQIGARVVLINGFVVVVVGGVEGIVGLGLNINVCVETF